MYIDCLDCGGRVYNGLCVNCDEECYIEDQYERDGDSAPQLISDMAAQQRLRRDTHGSRHAAQH